MALPSPKCSRSFRRRHPYIATVRSALKYSASQILSELNQQIGVSVCQLPMAVIRNRALQIKRTRDFGDRIIVANAVACNEAPLVTSDRRIHEHYRNAIWQERLSVSRRSGRRYNDAACTPNAMGAAAFNSDLSTLASCIPGKSCTPGARPIIL